MLHQQTFQNILENTRHEKFSHTIPKELEHRYNRFLCSLYFSPSLKGYPYLKQAFYYEWQNQHALPSLTKDIYEDIAKIYCTQVSAVERCITFSVKRAYMQNPDAFQHLFPDCKKAPSNFRFIKTVCLYLNQLEE